MVALLAALSASTSAAGAAPSGTFAGSLGVTIPKGAQAEVRAINRADGRIAATQTVGRTGRFSLRLPAGSYVVSGLVVPTKGSAATLRRTRIGVSLKAGQRRTRAKLKTKLRKRPAKRSDARARTAFVQERGQVTPGRVAVEIPPFTGATGELSVMNRGMANMLITDVVNGAGEDCDAAVVEVEHRDDILKELEFQKSPYVDPATRVERNFIVSDVEVKGSLTTRRAPLPAGPQLDYDVRIIDKKSGREVGRLQGSMSGRDVFAGEQELAKRLNEELCKLSDVYDVRLDVVNSAAFATHVAGGRLSSSLSARRSGKKARVWRGQGTFQWQDLTFTAKIPCSYIDPIAPVVPWSVTLTDQGGETLKVDWEASGSDMATASVKCPGSAGNPPPPPIPGQAGAALTTAGPSSFTVPYAGGTQKIEGGVTDGSGGWTNNGTMIITPAGVARMD
jgi:hypothetical protein